MSNNDNSNQDLDIPIGEIWKSRPQCQPDEMVSCPYFPEHIMRKKRFIYHLMKCEKNPQAPKLLACPFNYTHRVRYEDRKAHLMSCPDKPRNFKMNGEPLPSYKDTVKSFGINASSPKEWDSHLPENETEWWP